ncbi:uncharacterized protein LOC120420007 isoform X1 [Culex pipiens pallens]|uniref:uncharacterized protein LOC120420007 isoform X1 n=1 Tax=Culex pipiens pallens TaxID=42434 RepID=UPI001953AB4C|nr:uncharacterized protein LOC120420007 isoform X1 [Culex pipiens pallens]XP_052565690.1 uncharacterized protein LOC120420007 isoform X1 [Culex pipiens pallens]
MMADTNATSNGTTSGQEAVPQWKKELLQRRKNLAKTIGAASVPVHDSASTVAAALTTPTTPRAGGPAGNPFGGAPNVSSSGSGQKDPSGEATSSSPAATSPSDASPSALALALVDSPNRDSPASPTAAAFGTPVFVGHSPTSSPPGNELSPQQQVLVKSSLGRPTNTATREATGVLAAGTSEKQPLQHTQQSHSNDGPESTSIGSNSRAAVLAAVAPAPNSGPVGKYAAAAGAGVSGSVECERELTRPASGETNSYSSGNSESWKLKKNTSSASSPNGGGSSQTVAKMVAASAEEIVVYEKNRFVGNGTGTGAAIPGEVDSAEELKYGPGIVSKLRCRYLSLALRQSANKQRPSLNSMRRATSLNNLLDEESEDLSERENSIEAKDHSQDKSHQYEKLGREHQHNQLNLREQHQQQQFHQQKAKTPDEYISTFQKSVQNSYTRSGRQTEKKNEYNRYNKQRGADSLKRARSVEALVRYDHKAWERDIQKENLYSSNDSNVIILDEICSNGTATSNNINNSNGNNNNCQSVAMNKAAAAVTAELIVDCVTIEEKIINGREKGDPKPKRLTSFIDADERPPPDVVRQTMKIFEANANRRRPVARTNGAAGEVAAKVASYKSIISHEKPPITHPKPPLSPKKPNIIPRATSPKSNGTGPANTANGLKDKPPMLPKLDLNVIRTSLETTNNAKNAAATPPTPPIPNNTVTSTPLSVRVEPPQAYRLKYESPALSPNNNTTSKVTTTTTATNRAESPRFSTAAPALPASMQNNTNSTAATFVDSPSIQALTSKLSGLNIATSTPTSTRSPTPSDPALVAATPTPPQAPPRAVLQYTTSDEEDDDPDDPEQREYSINSDRGSDSQPDDLELDDSAGEDDDDDEPDTSKTVSRAAMDNIAKAGVTTQFRFNGGAQNKSHLPGPNNGGGGSPGVKLLASKRLNVDDHSSNSSSTSSSPITVPPPAVVLTQKPPVPLSRESLSAANGLRAAASVTANSNSLNNHSSSNANTSVNTNGSKLVINASDSASAPTPPLPTAVSSSDVKTGSLTAREIEKNQINLEKSGSEEASEKVVPKAPNNSGDNSASGGDFFMAKWGTQAATAPPTTAPPAVPVLVKKKVKAPPPPTEANTMVFNFSDRKDVPDYIENDGIILRPRPRELPKPGESGFVVLGDLTLETSTDPDDSWAMGPPSPCDVEFANANIVINGKSSMRNKTSRDSKFKIQFDDSLTSTFEYPSETSLLETNGFDASAVAAADRTLDVEPNNAGAGGGGGFPDNGLLSHKNTLLSSMPLGSAPFASYTPVKAAIDTTFELGVTRTPSPSSSASSTSNEHHPAQPLANGGGTNGISQPPPRFNGVVDGATLNGQQQQQDGGEPESIQYLKPASDEQTVNWSQGTRVTDLLF